MPSLPKRTNSAARSDRNHY